MTTPVAPHPPALPSPVSQPIPAASRGLTGRLASVSSRRPRGTLLAWGLLVLLALGLAATSLHGLTSTSHVVGTTPASRAETLYDRATGGSAGRQPTDVIVVSSKTATASGAAFRSVVGDLAARLRSDPGISGVRADLAPGSPLVSAGGHAALIGLHAASDADIKPVVSTVRAANGAGGFAVAVTGAHTVGNDFTTLSSSDLRHGEIDFGLPISIVILMLVFGAVVAGLMPMLMALVSIIVGLGIATIVAQEFSLSVFIVNMMTGMGLALGIDYSLFIISRFREERARGLDKDAAIAMTAATASRAVLFSGTTFVIALLGLFLVPTNVLRSLAAGAIIVGVVSVAAALTLLPAVLSLLGDRINALRIPFVGTRLGRADAAEGRVWRPVITRVIRRPVISLTVIGGPSTWQQQALDWIKDDLARDPRPLHPAALPPALLDRLYATAKAQDRGDGLIETGALRALALAAAGDEAGAVTALAEALKLAHPQGYVRVFADEGPPMAALLGRLIAAQRTGRTAAGVPLGYLARLRRAFDTGRLPRDPAPASIVDPLTSRELEVLEMLAAGRSNQAIAGELVVTLDTIKKHVGNVLAKLGAANRTEAVARARELSLIP